MSRCQLHVHKGSRHPHFPTPTIRGLGCFVYEHDLSSPFYDATEIWALLLIAACYRLRFFDIGTLAVILKQVLLRSPEETEAASRRWYAALGASQTTLYERRCLLALEQPAKHVPALWGLESVDPS